MEQQTLREANPHLSQIKDEAAQKSKSAIFPLDHE